MSLFKKDVFGRPYFIKKWVIRIIGFLSYRRFKGINSLKITGTKNLKNLPNNNVLLSSRNLRKAKVVLASELNTYDIMNANKMLFIESSIKVVEETF